MAYSEEQLDRVFRRTAGVCHICRQPLVRSAYGREPHVKGSWEVDHSKARSIGGADHPNNFYAAHPRCNRSKGRRSTRAARARYGYKRAPYSEEERRDNTASGALLGAAMLATTVAPQARLAAVVIGMVIGGLAGRSWEPD